MEFSTGTGLSDSGNDISRACNLFCRDLYKVLASNEKKQFVHSPLGLHALLSLVSYGAEKSTAEELKAALYFSDALIHKRYKDLILNLNGAKSVQLKIANAIYIQKDFPVSQEFLNIGSNSFQANISNVDFSNKEETIEIINTWVKNQTQNRIHTAVLPSDIDDFTRLILLNVLHFKGTWYRPFDVNKTALKDFHVSDSIVRKIPFMVKEATFTVGSIPQLQTEFIEIPYKNMEFVMVILKPYEIDGLAQLEENFDFHFLSSIKKEETIELKLPKFKFEVTLNLNDALRQVDIKTMFSDDADFSKMSSSSVPLKISKIFQKIYIDVNEEGTEAASSIGAAVRLRRSANIVEEFVVDRPFMFVIKHIMNNNALFIGSIRDIESTEQTRDEL